MFDLARHLNTVKVRHLCSRRAVLRLCGKAIGEIYVAPRLYEDSQLQKEGCNATGMQLQPKMPEAAKLSSRERGGMACPSLPSITVEKMKQAQLRKFVCHLLTNVSGQKKGALTTLGKPIWWPNDVPWHHIKLDPKTNSLKEMPNTENLKRVIRSCYKYFGLEGLLNGANGSPESASSPLSLINDYLSDLSNVPAADHSNYRPIDSVVEVPSNNLRSKPRTRTVNRCLLPDLGQTAQTPCEGKAYPVAESNPFVEIYVCFFCLKEFKEKQTMIQHQLWCSSRQRPPDPSALKSGSYFPSVDSLALSPVSSSNHKLPKNNYMDTLGLVACKRARQIKARESSVSDLDCQIIDVIEPPRAAVTPPRTPKSLISQLSRDDSVRRKSVCFDISDNESVSSAVSESEEFSKRARNHNSLLVIPLTSALGQRVRKNVKVDSYTGLVDDADRFCRTPVKNTGLGRLRARQNLYPVTFKKTKRLCAKHCHNFKFNRKQTVEFLECLKAGLDRRSLDLFKQMKKCSVKVLRLSRTVIDKWLMPKIKSPLSSTNIDIHPVVHLSDLRMSPLWGSGPAMFPTKPALLSADVDRMLGLKTKLQGGKLVNLPLGSIVSEHLNAEASQQKLTVYRSLLSEYSSVHSLKCQPHPTAASNIQPFPQNTKLKSLLSPKAQSPNMSTQLAQMLLTPLGRLPNQPPNLASNHVEKWLSNNNFRAKNGRFQLSQSSFNKIATVREKLVERLAQKTKRPLDKAPHIPNKRRKISEKQEHSTENDAISICSVSSSSEDEGHYTSSKVSRVKATASIPSLPVITNTFSLAPGQFQPPHSDPDIKLIIPPNLNLKLPKVNVQSLVPDQESLSLERSVSSELPLSQNSVDNPTSANRTSGHYSLRSTPTTGDCPELPTTSANIRLNQVIHASRPRSCSLLILRKNLSLNVGNLASNRHSNANLSKVLPLGSRHSSPSVSVSSRSSVQSSQSSAFGLSLSVKPKLSIPSSPSSVYSHSRDSVSPRRSIHSHSRDPLSPRRSMRLHDNPGQDQPRRNSKKIAPKTDDEVICID